MRPSKRIKYCDIKLENIFPVDSLQYLENLDEEVDDVQVELNCRGDVLLRGDPGHDHLHKKRLIY
jgi:hypothetical protein